MKLQYLICWEKDGTVNVTVILSQMKITERDIHAVSLCIIQGFRYNNTTKIHTNEMYVLK